MTADQLKPDSRFFGLICGESSSGKDCLIASFPKPMLILDSDMRKGIISSKKWIGEEEFKQIEIKIFPPTKGFGDYDKELTGIQNLFLRNACPYKTIVLNSLTSLDRILMTDAFEFLGGNIVGPKDGSFKLRLSGPGDYKFQRQAFLTIFDYLKGFPINVIIVGHTVPRYVEKDPSSEYSERIQDGTRLSLTEKLANDLLIYFDEAYECFKSSDGARHYVQFRTNIARTCYERLPRERLDITNKNFYQTWLQYITEAKP